ncbi:hypothetical protein [uncultured Legionella sp.]|uniref:fused DSP-PTPase phosphatase/NAD kinase-like protein n=1 Tax=uncultured Legionella sp. TaxID=210934 RepID=UPI002601962F|nr:hypothetical protein [uncultured Legionella sp.]
MRKLNHRLLSIFILITACLGTEAAETLKITESKCIKLPDGAFWIDNYRSNNHGVISLEPAHWRATSASPKLARIKPNQINRKGLDNLSMSGSANPTLTNMHWLKKNYGATHSVYIIDLRQETHLFINGSPVSIFYKKDEINWGKTLTDINQFEHYWVNNLLYQNTIKLNKLGRPVLGLKIPTKPQATTIQEVYTEAEAAKMAGIGYFRIDVPDYHPPAPEQVDLFVQFVKKAPAHSWFHFHCAAGKGRTTTFMVMRDILANGTQVELIDIVTRQALLGGIDLFASSKSLSAQPWKKEFHEARVDFIKLFYTYIHNGIEAKQSFAQWIKKQPPGAYKAILHTAAYPQ